MDYRLERVREFASANLHPTTDADHFCARVQKHNYDAIFQWENRIRIGKSIYRLGAEESAEHMAFLLADYIRDHGLKVRFFHD